MSVHMTGPAKIDHVSAKKSPNFCICSIITIHTNTIKSLPLQQNLMGFLLKFTEIKYYTRNLAKNNLV